MRPISPNTLCNPSNLPLTEKSDILNREKRGYSKDKRLSKMTNQSINKSQPLKSDV